MTSYIGIDYGLGQSNIDRETGIRFGVIHQNALGSSWFEDSEPYYGKPSCGYCGNEAIAIGADEVPDLDDEPDGWIDEGRDFACLTCKRSFDSDDAYGDEPLSFGIDDGQYVANSDEQGDIFITKSPYYTRAQYCSPCAPGAVYLTNEVEDGPKGYCFGHEWFEDGKAPYKVYRVADDSLVER